MESLRRIFRLGLKEFVSLRYDPVLLLFVIYAFTLDVVTATDQAVEVRNASVAVVDEDRSQLSARIADAFLPPRFKRPVHISHDQIDTGLDRGHYTFVVDIPPDFEADLKEGKRPEIQVDVDATAVGQAFNGSGYIQSIITEETNRFFGWHGGGRAPPVSAVVRIKYNQNMNPVWFLGIAELLMMITVLTMMLPAAALIREQEHGTIEHLLVMPLTPAEIMLAKVWSNMAVVQLGTVFCLYAVIEGWLDIPVAGSVPLFLFGTMLYQFAATAIGMVLATVVRTVQQFVLVMILVIAPMVFLSGVFSPMESMTPALHVLMRVSPLLYYVDFSFAVLFRNAGPAAVAQELVVMAAIGGLLFFLAMLRFRRHFSMAER